MDSPLQTSRQRFDNTRGGRYHGGGRYHRGRGGRGRRGFRRPYRGRNNHSYQPRNRFDSNTNNSSQNTMELQLATMIAKMTTSTATVSKEQYREELLKHIQDLTNVLCEESTSENFFVTCQLHSYIVKSTYSIPLYQGAYATLTMCIEKKAPQQYKNFIQKCVNEACLVIRKDLETIILGQGNISNSFMRCKLLFRYLAMLGSAGVLEMNDTSMMDDSGDKMTFMDLLNHLLSLMDTQQCLLISLLIMEILPYLLMTVPVEEVVTLKNKLEDFLQTYNSAFQPSKGFYALLLKEETYEEGDEDEDEESDDEEEEAPCCDTLQDLIRNVRVLVEESGPYFSEEWLWKYVSDEIVDGSFSKVYLGLNVKDLNFSKANNLHSNNLHGIVFGRFPIYSPLEDDDEEDISKVSMKPQDVYCRNFSLLDKFFLHASVRDILHCYYPQITSTGSHKGILNDVTDQLQSLKHFFPSKEVGIEFGIVECIIGLILQSNSLMNVSKDEPLCCFPFLCRILVEYVKSSPSIVPKAIVSGVNTILEDMIKSIVPTSQCVTAEWLGFHLVNTDFQWPQSIWDHWSTYSAGCRRGFIEKLLGVMISYTDWDTVERHVGSCINVLSKSENSSCNDGQINVQIDLREKINQNEDSANIATWLCTMEQPTDISLSSWRTRYVIQSILPLATSTEILSFENASKHFTTYSPLLTCVMEKDDQEQQNDDFSHAQLALLEEIFNNLNAISFYQGAFFLDTLQKNQNLHTSVILKFLVEEKTSQWWYLAFLSLKLSLCLSGKKNSAQEEGSLEISIDGKAAIDFIQEYIVQIGKVFHSFIEILVPLIFSNLSEKRNSSSNVVLLDGLKFLIRNTQIYCYNLVQSEVQKAVLTSVETDWMSTFKEYFGLDSFLQKNQNKHEFLLEYFEANVVWAF